ncbi:TraB/GumN family protein [Caulobacter segnis]
MDPTNSLSAKLTPEAQAQLAAAANVYGLPPAGLERMRPWLAATTLGSAPLLRAGWDPRLGVDMILQVDAKARGKAVFGLETAEQQARFLADLPEARQVEELEATLRDLDAFIPRVESVQAAWLKGDQAQLAALGAPLRATRDPGLDAVVRMDRNRAWAAWIKARLGRPGTAMIVVGAGHLFGKDSLGDFLAVQEITIRRS